MIVLTNIALLEEILGAWKERIGVDYEGYKNHVYRMLNFCVHLYRPNEEEMRKLVIAAAHHDIGIWSDGTVDYLPPSVKQAQLYLQENGLTSWSEEITLMIEEHHKVRQVHDSRYPLIEIFRRGDLVDFSLGLVKWGIPKAFVKQVKSVIPNAGFHKLLLKLTWGQVKKHPLNPAPMMKW